MENKPKAIVPKIVIGVPTYEGKNYCLEQFLDNLSKINYPKSRLELVFADNSKTNENARFINKKYGIKVIWKDYTGCTVFEKMADSHNSLRKYFLESDANYFLHLESDIFPPENVLWELLWARKPIVNGMYQIYDASYRTPCISLADKRNEHWRSFEFSYTLNNHFHYFVDGKIKPVYIAGIGCCLMNRNIAQRFSFRYDNVENLPPDTYFAKDLLRAGVQNYVHTGLLCFHWNREEWGRHYEYIEYLKSE